VHIQTEAVTQYRTLVEAFLAAPPDREFVTMYRDDDDISSTTFGEFTQQVWGQAAQFASQGLRSGETVILIMPQGIPLMVCFTAAMFLGAVPTILAYPNFKIEPSKYRFGLTGVSRNLKARLIVLDEEFPDELLSHITIEDAQIVRAVIDNGGNTPCPAPGVASSNQLAFIQHSAGTTGLQKGVALSHSSVLAQLKHLADALHLNDQDRIYSWLPLYHDMGLIACFMLPLVYHVPVVMQSPTDWVVQPSSMPYLIGKFRCTLCWIPNFTFQFLARRVSAERRSEFDLSSLRMAINCSEPVRARSMDEFYAAYASSGLRPDALQSSYAMAENVFAVTQSGLHVNRTPARIWVNSRSLIDRHLAELAEPGEPGAICLVSSGKCLPGNRVRIVDETGEDLPNRHVGEILIESDSLFAGYHNRPELTAKALKDGWYYSGDLGLEVNDELYVIGRKTDLIIVAGKNIHPHDVEQIAGAHPKVHDGRVVAFGLFNPELGTQDIIIVAEVENEDDMENASSLEHAIRSAVVAELGVAIRAVYIKPPKWIVKSTAGKPARSASRQKLLQEEAELSGRNFDE
jgi:acyl-CoA synthetase (AMP-forming)/AMP-acid ligase II